MKNTVLFLGLFLYGLFATGQIVLTDAEENNITNDTLRVYGEPSADYIKANLFFSNNSDETAYVFVRKNEIAVEEGSSVTFCWNDFCFSPAVVDVDEPLGLEPGESSSDTDFYSEIYPQGVVGESVVEFEFFSDRDDFEVVTVTVIFVVSSSTSIPDAENSDWKISEPYPNPARDFAWIDYQIPTGTKDARLVVRNLVGNLVLEQPLSPEKNRTRISTNQLSNGLYIYSMIYNNKVFVSHRLIIAN